MGFFGKFYNFSPLSGGIKRKTLCRPSCWQMKNRCHFKHPSTWMPVASCSSCHTRVWPLALVVSPILEMDTEPAADQELGAALMKTLWDSSWHLVWDVVRESWVLPHLQAAAPGCGSTDQLAGTGNQSQPFLSNFWDCYLGDCWWLRHNE